MARDLDEQVEAFRTRPLDAGPYTFAGADALGLKVREGGCVVNVHALLAGGVNADGHGRSSACRSPPLRTAPAGSRSSAT
jgi:putative transposase